jgi:two-component sensor histidine kinase
VPTLNDLLARHADLVPADVEWLHLLVGDWQMLSDLSFADLVLWAPDRTGDGWVAVAHCRPSTGATVHNDDVVGTRAPVGHRIQVDRAGQLRRICRDRDPEWYNDIPVREEAVPVVRDGRVLAVVGRHTNLVAARIPSRLELTYLQCADDLARMIAAGDFPSSDASTGPRRGAPRVGDGLIRLDRDGRVTYASPNALSAVHRLGYVGEVIDESLSRVTAPLIEQIGPVDESLPLVLSGRVPWRSEMESRGTTLSLRSIPLTAAGQRIGALVLLRDVSELRRRERELMTKDATIREVHHRVKNNLQTVAALLRLQARRIRSDQGRLALQEAMRRVSTIALVHETLSEKVGGTVDFDDVVGRTATLSLELASAGASVYLRRQGRFGVLHAENATPLALVLAELVTNAVEHGLGEVGGTVTLSAHREGTRLTAIVDDDGVGLPEGFVAGSDGLGTQIVQALVGGQMRGSIRWESPPDGGTRVTVEVTVRDADDDPVDQMGSEPESFDLPGASGASLALDDLIARAGRGVSVESGIVDVESGSVDKDPGALPAPSFPVDDFRRERPSGEGDVG